MSNFDRISIVLVRPAGDLNVGAVARAMMNTGFCKLVIVGSRDFQTPDTFRMAVSAREIIENARQTDTLHEALADCHSTFAVTARPRHKRPRLSPIEAAETIAPLVAQDRNIALVFGPEDHGLSSEEVDACNEMIGIPAHPDLTSYNLAQAVLLVCYTLFTTVTELPLEEKADAVPATHEDRRRIETQFLTLLQTVDYLTENRKDVLEDMTRRLVYRADLETRDVRSILAIIRHLNYKLDED